MKPMTVHDLACALDHLRNQDAPVVLNTACGEKIPYVIDTGEARILAASWDPLREVYVIHTTEMGES